VRILAPLGVLVATLLVGIDTAAAGAPTVTGVSPNTSSTGVTVKVLGSGLGETSAAVFGGNVAGTIVSKAAGEVDVVVPSMARTGSLILTTPGGTASTSFYVMPNVSGHTNSHTVGSTVTISGSGLANVTSVSIDGANASFHVVSALEIQATIPADAAPTGALRVHSNNGSAGDPYFHVDPTISGFSPASAAVGATITIGGTGFGSPQVRFHGGSTGTVTDSSHTTIKVTVPAAATTGPITVTTPGGSATSVSSFTVIVTPDFSLSVAPASQTVRRGGRTSYTVTITSSNGFNGSVQLTLSGLPGIGLPGITSPAFSPDPVPAGGTSSTLTIPTSSRMATGTYTLTISGASGSLKHTFQVSLTLQ
jgi:IPT/TIG domain-containing protein